MFECGMLPFVVLLSGYFFIFLQFGAFLVL